MAGDSVVEGLEVEMEEERVVEERVEEEVVEECPRETSFPTKAAIRGRGLQLAKQLFHQNRHQHAPDSHDYLR